MIIENRHTDTLTSTADTLVHTRTAQPSNSTLTAALIVNQQDLYTNKF